MAKFYPPIEIIKSQKIQPTEGEKALLNCFWKNLNDSYEIFYRPFINGDRPDMVIARKGSGILIIGIKDWQLDDYKVVDRSTWMYKFNDQEVKSPFAQVLNYKENMFNLHSVEMFNQKMKCKATWYTINCIMYFSKMKLSEINDYLQMIDDGKEQEYLKNFGILGCDSLTSEAIGLIFRKFGLNRKSKIFGDNLYLDILRYLNPPFHQIEEGRVINYTEEQKQLIKSEVRPRRKIKGIAGSGKTFVLARRAVNAHTRTGTEVLILTYNLSLKNYIHDRIKDIRDAFNWNAFYITNYHQFFKDQANNHGLKIGDIESFDNPRFFEWVKDKIQPYSTIFIDEIQDFKQEWIDLITTYFTREDTEFVVFGDEKQNIYERELDTNREPKIRAIPGAWNKTLTKPLRSATKIMAVAIHFQTAFLQNKYTIDQIGINRTMDFEQQLLEYYYCISPESRKITKLIYDILVKYSIHSSNAAILSTKIDFIKEIDHILRIDYNENTVITFETVEEGSKCSCKEDIENIRRNRKNNLQLETGTIKLSTIHSFKGWETHTLFLIIENDSHIHPELIYTGITRAMQNLIVINLGNVTYHPFFQSLPDFSVKQEI